jgi:DHA3 family macrolide efflux protein-like MFS transporter
MGMISTSMMPIGMLIFGPLADMVKIEWLLIGTGAFIMCLSLLLVKNHVLIEAGKSSG